MRDREGRETYLVVEMILVEIRSETNEGTDDQSEIGETRDAGRPAMVAFEREGDDGEEEEL
jgi:hypothetical protein